MIFSDQFVVMSLVVISAGFLFIFFLVKVLARVLDRVWKIFDLSSPNVKRCSRFAIFLLFFLLLSFLTPFAEISEKYIPLWRQFLRIAVIIGATGFVLSIILLLEEMIFKGFSMDQEDNLRSRKVHTQVSMLRKIVFILVLFASFFILLMSFETFGKIGTALLASAGIAGLVIGVSAQKTLATVLSGIQLAITQPVRIDDVVIVENEWGRIEELTLTYIVIRTWDLRRLIVPTTYFLEKPFQNWTRISAELLGTVFLYTDYFVPVDELRNELYRIVSERPEWNGKVAGIQVTGTNDKTMELRALVSASNSSRAWDLRCAVREGLIEFIRKNYPSSLPRSRVEVLKGSSEKATGNSGRP